MNFFKRGNKFTIVMFGMLLVVLVTAAFLPILPDSRCAGQRISYLTLMKSEWNKRQHKKDAAVAASVTSCKK